DRDRLSPPAARRQRACPRRHRRQCRGRPMSKTAQISVLTANRLGDGIVVFLDFEGAWSESLDEAIVARSPDEVKALEDRGAYDAARNLVVEPHLVEVREAAGRLTPIRHRERV